MLNNGTSFSKLEADLGLNIPFVKGQTINVRNCWHFSTNGDSVELMFFDETDFRDGMNRIYVVSCSFDIVILAFTLMDSHVHFVLYGAYDECYRFVHEYLRRTSLSIRQRHNRPKELMHIQISHQIIDTDRYLKNAICYVCRNAPAAGLPYSYYDYPWSSAALYFRTKGTWVSPSFMEETSLSAVVSSELRTLLKTRYAPADKAIPMIDGLVFPGKYVAVDVTERIFRTCKSFFYFMTHTREDDIESRGGEISRLSIPIHEMRRNRNEICRQMFGTENTNILNMSDRLKLARTLRSRYNCSVKQIARVCGLVYSEVENLL